MTSQKESVELLPCPFCGSAASKNGKLKYTEDFARDQGWDQHVFYFVNCPNCGASNQGINGYPTTEAAVEAWNTRTQETKG